MLPVLPMLLLAVAPPPPAAAAAPGPPVADVTVVAAPPAAAASLGRRAQEVQAVLATPRDQLTARWADRYCPTVSGLEPGQAARIAAAMAARAREAGLLTGRADCTPNVSVLVSPDPDGEVERLLKRQGRVFGEARAAEVRKALEDDRPVRWLSTSLKLSADGMPLGPSTFKFRVGHILSTERYDLSGVIVLVDARRVDGLSLAALADYLAFVSLAQVRADPPAPHPPTVLDLFADAAADPARATGLTAWDRGFLKGLYRLDPASNPGMQRFGVAEDMARTAAAAAPPGR